ncbi:hypothetical protein BG011_003628 [Mortierella polycephala]|uniref:MFS general substrate transporter n=1 Tax=Mortierella polycephala TaxID=41804 RepID=A0A9P6Q3M7_9FUNG|nr:hypothetical protein BG011_003628 [Mortierella polycephala]
MVTRAMRQIILIGIICFGTIGMFNAMSSIGNAGKHSPTAQNLAITASSIAYIFGFLIAGGTHNMLGPRPCVAFGGLTFFLYAGAMMLAKDNEHSIYPPLAGVLLGLGAGCIWVTQGAMMMSYPTEGNKGKYIACFWAIFNLGAVFGSILPLVMNSAPGMDPDDVSPDTYIVYMVIMGLASVLAIFLARPSSILRDDGEPVIVAKFVGLKAEFVAILSVFCDWRMLLLIPAFFFSNFSYTYQFNDFNGFNFNIRTRSLNSIIFWVAQIIGALFIGHLLDRIPLRRPRRAILGLAVVALLFMGTWIGALMIQLKHKWDRKVASEDELIDFEHGDDYTGPLTIYTMFGFCDAAFAVYCYWLMGALSNKHDELSRYAGFFKSIQSLGSAVAAPLDLAQTPFLAYLITNWILCAFSIAAMFLVCRTITDTTVDGSDMYEDGEEGEMDEAGSNHRRSTTPGATEDEESPSTGHTSSFEGDSSTICVNNEGDKAVCGARTNGQRSGYWRSSARTMVSDCKDQEAVQDSSDGSSSPRQSPESPTKRDNNDSCQSTAKRRTNSVVSATSMTNRTTCPSPTYQHPHQYTRRSTKRLSRAPPMTEIRNDTSYLAQMRQSQHLSVPVSPQLQHHHQSQESQQSLMSPSIALTAESTTYPPLGIESSFSEGIQRSGSLAPTFVISQESSPPVPLYPLQPQHDPYLYSSWATNPPALSESGNNHLAPSLNMEPMSLPASSGSAPNGYLHPHNHVEMNVPPMVTGVSRSSFGGASSSGSTRYDEDQDMDSIETCSLSSMSSGQDSIPEMSEMASTPVPRPARNRS